MISFTWQHKNNIFREAQSPAAVNKTISNSAFSLSLTKHSTIHVKCIPMGNEVQHCWCWNDV